MIKTCVGCVNFLIYYDGDYSEVTPGSGFMMSCRENKFDWSQNGTQEEFEAAITTAQRCELFQLKPGFEKGRE